MSISYGGCRKSWLVIRLQAECSKNIELLQGGYTYTCMQLQAIVCTHQNVDATSGSNSSASSSRGASGVYVDIRIAYMWVVELRRIPGKIFTFEALLV